MDANHIIKIETLLNALNEEIVKTEHMDLAIQTMKDNIVPELLPYVITITSLRSTLLLVFENLSSLYNIQGNNEL